MVMKLSKLLEPWAIVEVDCDIFNLKNDSRGICKGDLFLAYPGHATDGRLSVSHVVQAGASAILYESRDIPEGFVVTDEIPCIPILNLAHIQGLIASRFYDDPTRALSVIGVTGTNGKTTIAYQLAEAHDLLGVPAAYMGTLGQGHVDQLQSSGNTTPDPLLMQA